MAKKHIIYIGLMQVKAHTTKMPLHNLKKNTNAYMYKNIKTGRLP